MIRNVDSPGSFLFYNAKNSAIMNPKKISRGRKINR
jgi:hypothetical protein